MQQQLSNSIGTLQEIQSSAQAVDSKLLARAQGIAIVSDSQWALAVGGLTGRGVLMRRMPDGRWSPPCAITTGGMSLGLSLGGEARSLVILFNKEATLDRLVSNGTFFLANAQGTFGGSHGQIGEPVETEEDVHAYIVASGLFASAALGGMSFSIADDVNQSAYGAEVTAWDILDGHVKAPPGWRALETRLDRMSGARQASVPPPTPPNASVVETPVETALADEPAAPPRKPTIER